MFSPLHLILVKPLTPALKPIKSVFSLFFELSTLVMKIIYAIDHKVGSYISICHFSASGTFVPNLRRKRVMLARL
jgi:uncharacterized membrane protein